ncbi:MAG: hypothetical protein AAFN77_00515 [Planctomycetota bacterium]
MSPQEPVDFNCPNCAKLIRASASSIGGEVACPFCSKLVSVPGQKTGPKIAAASAIPIDDDGDDLPSLEALQNSSQPAAVNIELPDELDANMAELNIAQPNNELASLVDDVLEEVADKPADDPNAPIKLDDDDTHLHDDVIGVTCSICDTRIHVRQHQIGTEVECPVCFVKVRVYDPKTRKKVWGRGGRTASEERQQESKQRIDSNRPNPTIDIETVKDEPIKQSGGGAAALPSLESLGFGAEEAPEAIDELIEVNEDAADANGDELGELKLSDPIERPSVQPVLGLDPIADDLLTPTPISPVTPPPTPTQTSPNSNADEDVIELEPLEDDVLEVKPLPPVVKPAKPKTKSPKPNASQAKRKKRNSKNIASTTAPKPTTESATRPPQARPAQSHPGSVKESAKEKQKQKQKPSSSTASQPNTATTESKSGRPQKTDAKSSKSRKERLEAAQRDAQLADDQDTLVYELPAEQQKFPEFELTSLYAAVRGMLLSPGLIWRVMIAVVLMIIGASLGIYFFPAGTTIKEAGLGDFASRAFMSITFGAVPYYLGLMALWTIAGYIFREAALGRLNIKSWSINGFSEIQGTFLLFAFSFFVAGSVAVFLPFLTMPLRVLLAPIFLASAFFNRSVWGIVAADIFSNASKLQSQWVTFYIWMLSLAGIGMIAGLLFYARGLDLGAGWINPILSTFGVVLNTVVTLVFAAVTGWHAGLINRDLQEEV